MCENRALQRVSGIVLSTSAVSPLDFFAWGTFCLSNQLNSFGAVAFLL